MSRSLVSSWSAFGALLLVGVVSLLWACAASSSGSGAQSATRAQARGATLAVAEAVKIGDTSCAKVALARKDLELARTCERTYAEARSALLFAASEIDAWDEGRKGDVTCAIVHAASSLREAVTALRAREPTQPPLLDDALRLAEALGSCHELDAGAAHD